MSRRKKIAVVAGALVALWVVLVLIPRMVGGPPPAAVAPTATPTAQPAATPIGYVSRAMLGDRWPLTVSHGTLTCLRAGAVFFDAPSGRTYAVNGMAASMFPALDDIDRIWANDPANPGLKKNIGPLIDAGLALCN